MQIGRAIHNVQLEIGGTQIVNISRDDILRKNITEHRIVSAIPLGVCILLVTFSSGEKRFFDASILTGSAFIPLERFKVFQEVSVERGTVTWMNGAIDVAPEYVYEHSVDSEEKLSHQLTWDIILSIVMELILDPDQQNKDFYVKLYNQIMKERQEEIVKLGLESYSSSLNHDARWVSAELVLNAAIEDYSRNTGLSEDEIQADITKTGAYAALHDYDTGLWMEGPDYFIDFYLKMKGMS